ncbi:UDP-Glycosyltransferase superfamily protein, putative [Theobroma cacao]|uniref:UDP-Glycosyltransferase superfamily protein, putative n=1 Tax=Theobroma cacao TaxID=3641 RepID=A0A061FXN1_THECC|nr:UDP-Glycosyltransferase superfamily protein, putative [Theobroma cacao]
MARKPHVLAIPFPAQGHVAPFMKLALQIAANGVKITFVNSESVHERIMASVSADIEEQSLISLVSIPDALESRGAQRNAVNFTKRAQKGMPGSLKNLIEKINQSNINEQITCVLADTTAVWALEVAKEMGIGRIAVQVAGPAVLALSLQIPQLLGAGILDNDGILVKGESISLSKEIPAWSRSDIPWSSSDPEMQKAIFGLSCTLPKIVGFTNLILSNTFYELDASALKLVPNILPIGPLHARNYMGTFAGNFWPEDSICISWLDQQTAGSVIYVAFGSTGKFSPQQVDELALGLELTGHPFLWVVRSNLSNGSVTKFPEGFIERIADRGKIVEWGPQEKVLAHPSVACFVSHCGWNSTLEGLSKGIPFLCWPYFTDQLHNKSYICDVWRIGLGVDPDENGIITRHEISTKIKAVLSSDAIKANALHLKELARKSVNEGGSSYKNFKSFIEQIKGV